MFMSIMLMLCWLLISGLLPLTKSSDEDDIRFFHYDNTHPAVDDGKEIKWKDSNSSSGITLRKDVTTKILIHGFVHNHTCWFPQELKDAYIRRGRGENIITVDWGPLVNPSWPFTYFTTLMYPKAVVNVGIAGKRLGEFITFLVEEKRVPLKSIHIIGLSLGSHAAGTAGEYVQGQFKEKIGRITGLDPAAPLFDDPALGRCITKSDADFVDIVHTNQEEYGLGKVIGHVDFYINGGGPYQPECGTNTSCSHNAAANYFLKSINNESMQGCMALNYEKYSQNKNCTVPTTFGDALKPSSAPGVYFVDMKLHGLSEKYSC